MMMMRLNTYANPNDVEAICSSKIAETYLEYVDGSHKWRAVGPIHTCIGPIAGCAILDS